MSLLFRLLAESHRRDRQERAPVTVRLEVDGTFLTNPGDAKRRVVAGDAPGPDDATPALACAGPLP